ncbi:hypothetical protein Cob_v002230 [Colletotrichum orbiculare MAFF 240422]|uniref:Uncharacterized protein n=1 Tax=Colletotrichum orbiculare (strain 104-T / ATCC 96160 / CBS 514.97 / LARS 414 / MAFF 240422) TaxID=1213857 RepID=A0A484G322_COLOR|nr:hypothetical protein Cob_v002230 [Colletotrichum orbiculare MAFF 240422]
MEDRIIQSNTYWAWGARAETARTAPFSVKRPEYRYRSIAIGSLKSVSSWASAEHPVVQTNRNLRFVEQLLKALLLRMRPKHSMLQLGPGQSPRPRPGEKDTWTFDFHRGLT